MARCGFGTDGDPDHQTAVAFERAEALAALQVPNPQRFVVGRRDCTASVRRDGDPVHRIAVAFERAEALALNCAESEIRWPARHPERQDH